MEQAKDGDPQTACWNLREGRCILLHDEQHVGQQDEAQRHADRTDGRSISRSIAQPLQNSSKNG